MKAIVLVGGEGTRLRPLTFTIPKQMLPIVGVPMIERVVGHLGSHGVDEAILSLGYLPDAFMRAYPDSRVGGVKLTYAVEASPLDTAGAVRFAADQGGVDDTFIVVNGDVLTDLDVTALVGFHRRRRAEATIRLFPVPDPSRFGVVTTEPDGRVTAFIEKPPLTEAPSNQINAGTYVFEPSVLERIPRGRRVSMERETFPALVRAHRLYALSDDAYWLDAGTPAAYLQANVDLLEGRRGAPPAPGARLAGPGLWVTGRPEVEGEVGEACFAADGARVAAGARIDRSVLGAGAVVEEGSTVTGSVLLPGARVATRSTIEDSVLGPGAVVGERCEVRAFSVLGAGAVVASGTRIDGERVPA